jgi:hypothetical protein
MWRRDEIGYEIIGDQSDYPIVAIRFETPAGDLFVLACVHEGCRTLSLHGLHIHGAAPNAVGIVNLRVLGRVIMEELGYDELIVQGAGRTTGTRAGPPPRQVRLRRQRDGSSKSASS